MNLHRFLALILATASLPTAAIITTDTEPAPLPAISFDAPYRVTTNVPLSISGRAWASALFAGQGWDLTAMASDEVRAWEFPVGDPTAGVDLALFGQYASAQPSPPVGPDPVPTPPVPSPAVDETRDQNVSSTKGGSFSWFGGVVDGGFFFGTTSILFKDNVNLFTVSVLDAGIGNGLPTDIGGPLHFKFFDRQGASLGIFDFAHAVNGVRNFRSDMVDIAGVQIWHQDPRGLEFRTLSFGIIPVPTSFALVLLGLAALRRTARRATLDSPRG